MRGADFSPAKIFHEVYWSDKTRDRKIVMRVTCKGLALHKALGDKISPFEGEDNGYLVYPTVQ